MTPESGPVPYSPLPMGPLPARLKTAIPVGGTAHPKPCFHRKPNEKPFECSRVGGTHQAVHSNG